MPTLLPRESMAATSVISASIQRPSPFDHRVGFSITFTRLLIGSLALRPALLLFGNSRPRVTTTPLPHTTGAYGQLPGRDFNPLDLSLLLRTLRSPVLHRMGNGRPEPVTRVLWDDCDAQVGERTQVEPDWDRTAQRAPEFDVDQRVNW